MGRNRALTIGLGLLLAVLVAAAVRGAVRDTVVVPLLYLVWGGQLLLDALPQGLPWTLLVVLAAVLAGRSLEAISLPHLQRRAAPEGSGRVASWLRLIQLTKRDEYSRWRLAQRLGQLAVELLAAREGLTPQQARRRIADPSLPAPDAVRAYLITGLAAYQPRPGSQGRVVRGGPLDTDTDAVIRWLEEIATQPPRG